VNSLIEQIRVERPNERAYVIKIFTSLTIGLIATCAGLSGTLNDGKGVPKLTALLLGSSLCGCAAYWSYEASQEKQIWEDVLEVKREVLQQAAAIEGEVSLEAHQALTEEAVLNSMMGGAIPVAAQPVPTQSVQQPVQQQTQQPQQEANPIAAQPVQTTVVSDTQQAVQMAQPQAATSQQPQQPPDPAVGEFAWIANMRNTGNVLVCGSQGSGKTGKIQYLQRWHKTQGSVIWVFDPHAKYGQYPDLEDGGKYLGTGGSLENKNLLFGGGMNFDQINQGMQHYIDAIKNRYERGYSEPGYNPFNEKRVVLICEEMQNWSKNVSEKTLIDFVDFVLTSTRKANFGCIISAQSEKVSQFLGKACRGNADLVEVALAKAKGIAVADPSVPGGYRPAPKGQWKPGGSEVWEEVSVPQWLQ
jgi:hypothetical protein